MARMTKNFFREEIKKSYSVAKQLLPTILKRYGTATKISPRKAYYKLWLDNDDMIEGYNRDTSWWVRGFCLHADNTVSIMVYWQGDSTDGDEYIDMPKGSDSAYLKSSEPVRIGGDYYIARHSITIRPNEIYEAIKALKI